LRKLALLGGEKAIKADPTKYVRAAPHYGIQKTKELIDAVTNLIENDDISFSKIAYKLEEEWATYNGVRYALTCNNGTASIHSAVFAVGVGIGDEVIVPAGTPWFTYMPVLSCNAIPVFCDIDRDSHNMDPKDLKKKITKNTKAVIPCHSGGWPCEMDEIMDIARANNLKVIEDASHAHGATYKGKKCGTFGDIGCFSMQASKLLPSGEGGIMITDNLEYYERAVLLGHYERISELPDEKFRKYSTTSYGFKYRIAPVSAAIARVQLKYLDELNKVRDKNVKYVFAGLKKCRGIHPIEPPSYIFRTYYSGPSVRFSPKELGGVTGDRLAEALSAEGLNVRVTSVQRVPPYMQPLFQERNVHGMGCPFDCPHVKRKVEYKWGDCPVSETPDTTRIALPNFREDVSLEVLDQVIEAFEKVTKNVEQLL